MSRMEVKVISRQNARKVLIQQATPKIILRTPIPKMLTPSLGGRNLMSVQARQIDVPRSISVNFTGTEK